MPKYLLFLENTFPYMDNYNYHKGMKEIIQELKVLLKTKALAPTLTEHYYWIFRQPLKLNRKAIKLEKAALACSKKLQRRKCSSCFNLHANLGGLYRMNGYPYLARGTHGRKSLSS